MKSDDYVHKWSDLRKFKRKSGLSLRGISRHLILDILSAVIRKSQGNFLRALYCHYVFDDQLDKFESIIIKLKKVGEFVDTDTCMDIIEGKKKMNAQYFHLSFDDGFRNNYLNALPLLQKHSVPAIFFVPTSLIGAEYNRTAKYCLETTQNCAVLEMMSWDEIEKVLESGCEIGSHTRSHAHLISISSDKGQMRDEIFGSKSDIESRLKTECKYFSWPYGREKDIDDVSLKMIADAGYRGCFGAYRGSILPEKTDRFRIPRHHFEPFWPVSHIQFFARGSFEKNY